MIALIVVIAGGSGTRFRAAGGDDKLTAPLGAATVLQQLLIGLEPLGLDVLLVGPPRAGLDPAHRWVREDPPGGGPAAGLGAALVAAGDADVLVLLAADQPFAASAVPRLLAALADDPGTAGAIGVDAGGRRQPLLSAHRRSALQAPGPGRPVRAAFGTPLVEVAVTAAECLDIDTPADLEAARALLPDCAGPIS